jgi:hypothetical protein
MGRRSISGGVAPAGTRIQFDFSIDRQRSRPTLPWIPSETNLVALPARIEHLEWLEFDMLKVDAIAACDFFVEAAVAEFAIAALKGAVADTATDRDRLPATVAGVRCR